MSKKSEKIVDEVISEDVNDEIAVLSEFDLLKIEYDKLNDKMLRNAAELDNFKRRTNDEKQNYMKYASKNIMSELIEVVDNYEKALFSLENSEVDDSVISGVKLIFDQLNQILSKNGVVKMNVVGEKFDPNYHQAVMTGNDENFESGYVIEVFQTGYMIFDKILRPAMVKVKE